MDILYIALAILFIYLVFRYFLPLLLRFWLLRVFRKYSNARNNLNTNPDKPHGSVQIDYIPPVKKTTTTVDKGEFVDFEEIR